MSPSIGAIGFEAVVDDGGALRGVEQPRAQADQAAGRDREDDVRVVVVGGHLDELPAASADQLHHRAELVVRHFDDQAFERLLDDAVVLVQHDVRLADRELVAFAAHGFDEHREVQHAAAEDLERVARCRPARRGGRRSAPARVSSRAARCWLVTYLPSRPANGELLMPKTI